MIQLKFREQCVAKLWIMCLTRDSIICLQINRNWRHSLTISCELALPALPGSATRYLLFTLVTEKALAGKQTTTRLITPELNRQCLLMGSRAAAAQLFLFISHGYFWLRLRETRGDEMWLWELPVSNAGAWVIVALFTLLCPMAPHESEGTASEEMVVFICR